ncbi:MAG: hypothetical protein OES32_02675 [Acidobacteriota bacterium]|nr:hypothetical protein [Acidobacteriota bacterium]MDH3522467.1 hypothetical protein [Acidobacteriota bacterium]
MKLLRRATAVTALSLGVLFVLRLSGTIWPDLTAGRAAAGVAASIHLFTGAAWVAFFLALREAWVGRHRPALRWAAAAAAAGSAVALLPVVRNLLLPLDLALLARSDRGAWVEAWAPFVGILAVLAFFVTLLRHLEEGAEREALRRPATAALAACVALATLHALLLASWLTSGEQSWLTELGPAATRATLPLMLAILFALLWFFGSFYRFLVAGDGIGRELPPS